MGDVDGLTPQVEMAGGKVLTARNTLTFRECPNATASRSSSGVKFSPGKFRALVAFRSPQ
jgi:hypothetical protein